MSQTSLMYTLARWGGRALFLLSLVFVGYLLRDNYEQIRARNFDIDVYSLGAAALILALAYLSAALIWHRLAAAFGAHLDLVVSCRAWFFSQLGKYVPGKIPLLLFRLQPYAADQRKQGGLATIIEYLAMLAACALISLSALATAQIEIPLSIRLILLTGAALLLLAIWPPILKPVVNRLLQLLGRQPITEFPSYKALLGYVTLYIACSLMHGLAFFLLLSAIEPISITMLFTVTGIYQAGALIGIAAVFAPAGLGVRESIIIILLSLVAAEESVIIAALLMRLMTIAAELFLALLAYISEKIWLEKQSQA